MKNKITLQLKNKKILWFLIIIMYIIPPVAISERAIPKVPAVNFIVLLCCSIVCVGIMLIEGWKISDLDLEIQKGMREKYLFFTITGILILFVFKQPLKLKYQLNILTSLEFWIFWLILCFLQILSYRIFLFKKLEILLSSQKDNMIFFKGMLIILNGTIYGIMHIMFPLKFFLVCLIGGIFLALMYLENRNSKLMLASHLTLNFVAALLGYFPAV